MNTLPVKGSTPMMHAKLKTSIATLCVLATAGCAHAPPKELLDARAAYQRASGGLAAQQAPARLHTANNALGRAEQEFDEDGDSEHTRDLAYVAMRAAERAEIEAQVLQNENRLAQMETSKTSAQAKELGTLRDRYQQQTQQLNSAETARKDADLRAAQASADLARIATVKQEPRGMVITLSGEVLFRSGKSDLLGPAQAKLSEVARALTQQSPDATIVVEGHTDSQGGQTLNLELSRRRAEAVRDYLTSHGVAADRIRAEGLGFSRPLGDNGTPEGRANNRRVEIVVSPGSEAGG
ncbi:MAG TPA: OmpA family protein [Polyangiales bacterium]